MKRRLWLLSSVAACAMLVFYLGNCSDTEKKVLVKVFQWAESNRYILAQVFVCSVFALGTIGTIQHVLNRIKRSAYATVQPPVEAKTPIGVIERAKLKGEAKAIREELAIIESAREEMRKEIESTGNRWNEARMKHAAATDAMQDEYGVLIRTKWVYVGLIVDANRLKDDESQLLQRLFQIAETLNDTSVISS